MANTDTVAAIDNTDNKSAASPERTALTTLPAPGPELLQAQREATAASTNKDANQSLINNKQLPPMTLDGGVDQSKPVSTDQAKPVADAADASVKPKDSSDEAASISFVQQQLLTPGVLASITAFANPKLPAGESINDDVALRQKAITTEMTAQPPTWGPASQAAYGDFVKWVQSGVVPGAIGTLVSDGLPIPGGSPLAMPAQMSPQDYETKVATGQLSLDLGIDATKPPQVQDIQKLETAINWSNNAMSDVQSQQAKLADTQINTMINQMGFPQGWHLQPGQDDAAWRASATDMMTLYNQMSSAINVIDSYKLPVDLPPGAQVSRGSDGTIDHMKLVMPDDLKQDDPKNAQLIQQDKQWLQAANKTIQNALKDKNLPTLAFADTVIPKVFDKDGNKISAKASFDDKGNLTALVNPASAAADQLKNAQDANMLQQRYSASQVTADQVASKVTQTGQDVSTAIAGMSDTNKTAYQKLQNSKDGSYTTDQLSFLKTNTTSDVYNAALEHNTALSSPNGYITVTQQVQAQEVPWYSPQNLIYTNVGKPMTLSERFYQPGDLVAVQGGSGTEYVTAKDLPMLQATQEGEFYGQKALMLGLDVAMLATGSIEIGAAVDGAVALGTDLAVDAAVDGTADAAGALAVDGAVDGAGTLAAQMTAKDVAMTGLKGLFDVGLGASEPLNNADWLSSDGGQAAAIRNSLFLATMGWGLLKGGVSALVPSIAGDQAASAAQIAQFVKNGGAITQSAAQFSQTMMTWGMVPMAAPMAINVAKEIVNWNTPDVNQAAAAQAADNFTSSGQPKPSAQNGSDATAMTQTNAQTVASLKAYEPLVLENTSDANAKQQVSGMFDGATNLLNSGTDAQKQQFMQGLAANLEFTGTQVAHMEQMNGGKLTQEQLQELMNPATRNSYPNKVISDYASSVMNARNQDVVMASQMILLAMSRGQDGKVASGSVVSATTNVDSYIIFPHQGTATDPSGKTRTSFVPASEVRGETQTVDISAQFLNSALETNLSKSSSSNIGSAAFAVSDELVKSGGLDIRAYGAVLQDMLTDAKISDADKMSMLSNNDSVSFGETLLALNLQSQLANGAAQASGQDFGTNASDLEKVLSDMAANSQNPDLKAMAAVTLFAATTSEHNVTEGAGIMDGINAMYKQSQAQGLSTPGAFSQLALAALQNQLSATDASDVQTRLDAAAALSTAENGMPSSQSAAIDKGIADSLSQSFSSANAAQQLQILKELQPDRAAELTSENPNLSSELSGATVKSLTVPQSYVPAQEQAVIGLMQQMPALLSTADSATQDAFLTQAQGILKTAPAAYSQLKVATIQTLSQMGLQIALPLLRDEAVNDSDGAVRASAVQALAKIGDPQLSALVSSRLGNDPDPTVENILHNTKYSLDSASSAGAAPQNAENQQQTQQQNAAEFNSFMTDTNQLYPLLSSFDSQAQSQWIAQNFPLLSHDEFMNQARLAVKESSPGFFAELFTSTQTLTNNAVNTVVQQRNDQFNQLLDLAKIDPSQAANQAQAQMIEQARIVLASVISSNGSSISPSSDSFNAVNPARHNSGVQYQETSPDWAAQAANVFVDISSTGNSQRELTDRLISASLASRPTGATKAALLKAWQNANAPVDGITPISQSLYDYVASLA